MQLNERQRTIFDLLCERKKLTVSELARTLYVTEMTIRRDLARMEYGGYLKRYRGGATMVGRDEGFPLTQRMLIDDEEKRTLAKKAAEYLKDHMLVFIDSSSTAQFVIHYIKKFPHIRVITNSASALAMVAKYNIPCFLIGGDYCEREMCCIGPEAEKAAEKFNVDLAFMSTLGISNDGRITDSSLEITAVKERIMQNAEHTVLMFERSKFGKTGIYTLCHQDDERISVILSDDL